MNAASPLERLQSFDMSATISALEGVVRNPTGNTTLSIVVLVFVVIAVLMLVLFALMLITPSRKKVVRVRRYVGAPPSGAEPETPAESGAAVVAALRREQEQDRPPPGQVFLALTSPIAVTVLVLLAIVGGYVATSTNAYCAKTCHNSSDTVAKAESIDHAACVSCHETDGLFGVFANASSRARMLFEFGIGHSPSRIAAAVDSYACLRCHEEVGDKGSISKAGVRMSHNEVIEAGLPCSVCHEESGHTEDAFTASMSTCLPCHDAKTASAACSSCHTNDPGAVAFASGDALEGMGSGKVVYPAVRAANRRCGGCHDQVKECDYCHGIRMPHSSDFIEGAHARPAAFTEKLRCWRCHDPAFCSNTGCHGAFSPDGKRSSHAGDWMSEHKRADWGGGCVCHSGRGKRTGSMCYLCHAKDRSLLPIKQ